jgi:hypothetical protein
VNSYISCCKTRTFPNAESHKCQKAAEDVRCALADCRAGEQGRSCLSCRSVSFNIDISIEMILTSGIQVYGGNHRQTSQSTNKQTQNTSLEANRLFGAQESNYILWNSKIDYYAPNTPHKPLF